jgi:hypothetical protein
LGEWFVSCFWPAYPKKEAKADALAAIRKLNPDADLRVEILKGVTRAIVTEQWRKEGGKYIPYPATFINKRRWEDGGIDTSLFAPVSDLQGGLDDIYEANLARITASRRARGLE